MYLKQGKSVVQLILSDDFIDGQNISRGLRNFRGRCSPKVSLHLYLFSQKQTHRYLLYSLKSFSAHPYGYRWNKLLVTETGHSELLWHRFQNKATLSVLLKTDPLTLLVLLPLKLLLMCSVGCSQQFTKLGKSAGK